MGHDRVVLLLGLNGAGKTALAHAAAGLWHDGGVDHDSHRQCDVPTRPRGLGSKLDLPTPLSTNNGVSRKEEGNAAAAGGGGQLPSLCQLVVVPSQRTTKKRAVVEGNADEKGSKQEEGGAPTAAVRGSGRRGHFAFVDCSGAAEHRARLWPLLYLDEDSSERVAAQERLFAAHRHYDSSTSCSSGGGGGRQQEMDQEDGCGAVLDCFGFLPVCDGICFVVDGSDALRAALAWSEVQEVLTALHGHFKPLLVVVLNGHHHHHNNTTTTTTGNDNTDDNSQQVAAESSLRVRLDGAELLKLVEDFVVPEWAKEHWDIVDLDFGGTPTASTYSSTNDGAVGGCVRERVERCVLDWFDRRF